MPQICADDCASENQGWYRAYRDPDGLRLAVARVLLSLDLVTEPYDTIYVSGNSGIILGSIAAWQLSKKLMILRRPDETSFHGDVHEGNAWWYTESRYVIVDDFVSTGATLTRMFEEADGMHGPRSVAVVLYGQPLTRYEQDKGYVMPRLLLKYGLKLVRRGEFLFDTVTKGKRK